MLQTHRAMIKEVVSATYTPLECQLESMSSYDSRSMLLQWNLDNDALQVHRFRFGGFGLSNSSFASDYDLLLKDFFRTKENLHKLGIDAESIAVPLTVTYDTLQTSVMGMEFFDRLGDYVAPNGSIRGCFEEVIEGVPVNDLLRDVLINTDSDNFSLFSEDDKQQYIYQLFAMLVLGGAMCQSDVKTERYLNMTKGLYEDTLTVYKDNEGKVVVSGKVFRVRAIGGARIFSSDSILNGMIVLIDPLKKYITVIKKDVKGFW